jgi:hypothetical protein
MSYSNLITEKVGCIDGVTVWMLHECFIWNGDKFDVIVPAGFQTDFASVPRIPIAYEIVGDTAHEAGVVHDYLYREDAILYSLEMAIVARSPTRQEADWIFYILMREMGIEWFKRFSMYKAVRTFAGCHWHSRKVGDPFKEAHHVG